MRFLKCSILFFSFQVLATYQIYCQVGSHAEGVKQYNFSSFTLPIQTQNSPYLIDFTTPELRKHPEFGVLPYNAPCTDCEELIEKRDVNYRYYVKSGTNGSQFYSSMALLDLHYKNEKNQWITIDPRLKPTDVEEVFSASQQPGPTTLNIKEGYTSIKMIDGSEFQFNKEITIYSTTEFASVSDLQNINRSDYQVGDEGSEIFNAFDAINQQLIFGRASVKSNYILNGLNSVDTSKKFFVIEDSFEVPNGYQLKYDSYEGDENDYHFWHGELVLENQYGIEMARIEKPIIFDSGDSEWESLPKNVSSYQIIQTGNSCKIRLIIETNWLKSNSRIFPITIDPTVFGTTTTWTGTSGADDSPNWCTVSLSVPTPSNATLTGSSIYWDYRGMGPSTCGATGCRLDDLQLQINTSCGWSPGPTSGTVWICLGCNFAGHWIPTVDDATTYDLVDCFTPQCNPFNINFDIRFNQFSCVTAGGCVTTCSRLEQVIITIEGETVSTTALINALTAWTISGAACSDQWGWLNASPSYGVPGYTYLWSPGGETSDSVFATFTGIASYTYTLTVTDACGITATDMVTIIDNCGILPIVLESFTGYYDQNKNILNWVTSFEENNALFEIERSAQGASFEKIGEVKASEYDSDQFYTFIDPQPFGSINYYRLKQIDFNGDFAYSQIISILHTNLFETGIELIGSNPVTQYLNISIQSDATEEIALNIFNTLGELVLSHPLQIGIGNNTAILNVESLPSGPYFAKIENGISSQEIQIMKQ